MPCWPNWCRIGRRRIELDTEIRPVLISKLGTAVAAGVIGLLDSPTNVALRARLARHRMQHEDVDEANEETAVDMDDEVKIYCIYNDNTSST